MTNRDLILQPEDYLEPRCLLCETPGGDRSPVRQIPQRRVLDKMDEYMSRRDYPGAERHLLYWLSEAQAGGDLGGELLVRNELVGHYRKVGRRDSAFEHAQRALELVRLLGFESSVSAGTTYTNTATAYQAFGQTGLALELFEKARAVYEAAPNTAPELLGGLYNNMALACVSAGRYGEVYALYDLAMERMAAVPNGELEQAITLLNIANAVELELGMEAGEGRIFDLLDRAAELLDTPTVPRNGYYAFVCEKCAPTFSYYGYFMQAEDLNERARVIYERA